uniref:protein FAM83B-like n=1 Tax=Myxine glutinosa TaxID=7769 RepID=UPI00358E1596
MAHLSQNSSIGGSPRCENVEATYKESSRLAVDALVAEGLEAYGKVLKQEKAYSFLSRSEVDYIQANAQPPRYTEYDSMNGERGTYTGTDASSSGTYWPMLSDTSIPELDLGWPAAQKREQTNVTLYFQPPLAEGIPTIKQVALKLIRQATKVVAVVMDVFTDVDIFEALLDAACTRRVPVYILLDESEASAFVDMCSNNGVRLDRQQMQHSRLSSKLPLEATSVQQLFVWSFMKWVSMAEQPHTSRRSPCAMPSVGWSGVKLTAIGLWSSGNAFSGVMKHASPSGSPTDESGFGGCQEQQFGEGPFLFQHDNAPVGQSEGLYRNASIEIRLKYHQSVKYTVYSTSFTWTYEKINRSIVHIFTGEVVEIFDEEFRVLYGQSTPLEGHMQSDTAQLKDGPFNYMKPMGIQPNDTKHQPLYNMVRSPTSSYSSRQGTALYNMATQERRDYLSESVRRVDGRIPNRQQSYERLNMLGDQTKMPGGMGSRYGSCYLSQETDQDAWKKRHSYAGEQLEKMLRQSCGTLENRSQVGSRIHGNLVHDQDAQRNTTHLFRHSSFIDPKSLIRDSSFRNTDPYRSNLAGEQNRSIFPSYNTRNQSNMVSLSREVRHGSHLHSNVNMEKYNVEQSYLCDKSPTETHFRELDFARQPSKEASGVCNDFVDTGVHNGNAKEYLRNIRLDSFLGDKARNNDNSYLGLGSTNRVRDGDDSTIKSNFTRNQRIYSTLPHKMSPHISSTTNIDRYLAGNTNDRPLMRTSSFVNRSSHLLPGLERSSEVDLRTFGKETTTVTSRINRIQNIIDSTSTTRTRLPLSSEAEQAMAGRAVSSRTAMGSGEKPNGQQNQGTESNSLMDATHLTASVPSLTDLNKNPESMHEDRPDDTRFERLKRSLNLKNIFNNISPEKYIGDNSGDQSPMEQRKNHSQSGTLTKQSDVNQQSLKTCDSTSQLNRSKESICTTTINTTSGQASWREKLSTLQATGTSPDSPGCQSFPGKSTGATESTFGVQTPDKNDAIESNTSDNISEEVKSQQLLERINTMRKDKRVYSRFEVFCQPEEGQDKGLSRTGSFQRQIIRTGHLQSSTPRTSYYGQGSYSSRPFVSSAYAGVTSLGEQTGKNERRLNKFMQRLSLPFRPKK